MMRTGQSPRAIWIAGEAGPFETNCLFDTAKCRDMPLGTRNAGYSHRVEDCILDSSDSEKGSKGHNGQTTQPEHPMQCWGVGRGR